MDDAPRNALNTREFAVRWQAIVEEHFATRVADSLARLSSGSAGDSGLGPSERAALAQLVVQALHVAASPGGGVEEAVRFLVQAASEGAQKAGEAS